MSTEHEIDESLYSRQLYVMGHEAQKRLASSSVLIAGLNGLGVETAKNVTLMGVKSLTLYDSKSTSYLDLASQFYLTEQDIGLNRALVSTPKLAELNPYVRVSHAEGDLFEVIRAGNFHVVALIDQPFELQLAISEYCHANNIAFIVGDARGVFGQIFCDFGENFVVSDVNGEPNASSLVAGITRDTRALVTTLEETRHGLSSGDMVIFSDIAGMTELNGQSFTVTVKDPFSFEIDCDSREFAPYLNGGYINQIKVPQTISFQSFQEALSQPGEIVCDFAKCENASVLHLAFQALHRFTTLHQGALPTPGDMVHAEELFALVQTVNEEAKAKNAFHLSATDIDAKKTLIHALSRTAQGMISPMAAFLGGVLGQEILKAVSGKFMPIKQFFYFDAVEVLPERLLTVAEVAPTNTRYDGQVIVFGQDIQRQLASLNMFLVGAGAIGCEMVKNWAMMGIACDMSQDASVKAGVVHVTDMDQIEKSNLSRQFLFRNSDINCPKSTTALRAVKTMNPHFQGIAYEQKVSIETETFFGDDFFESLDFVCTALDNVDARLYVDSRCLFYRKPMLESGTLGAKGHTQIVSPGQTEHYGAHRDPAESSIPLCTLKHFPNQIEHTLQWARDWFEEIFKQAAEDIRSYLTKPDFFQQLQNQQNTRLETLKRLKASLVDERPWSYRDCLAFARRMFESMFNHQIQQLLTTFPLDRVTSTGQLFWSGGKKPPSPVVFDVQDALHRSFVVSVASLRAKVYGLAVDQTLLADETALTQVLVSIPVEEFRPIEGLKIAATDEELKQQQQQNNNSSTSSSSSAGATGVSELEKTCADLIASLPDKVFLVEEQGLSIVPIDFDKDIDDHMVVVAAASNLRARNYRIPEADLHTSRGIAGKIIPAIATTTAMVTGAVCLELMKVLQKKPIGQLHNFFANLAVPIFTSEEPQPPKVTKSMVQGKEWAWTVWDCMDLQGPNVTVERLKEWLNEEYGLEMSMLCAGVTVLFSEFFDVKKRKERTNMTLEDLVKNVMKKEIPSNQKYIIFQVMVTDAETYEDVDVPYLRYSLR